MVVTRQDARDRHPARRWDCRRGSVRRIFLAQGLVIGVVGTVLGLGDRAASSASRSAGADLIPLDPPVYFIDHLPVHDAGAGRGADRRAREPGDRDAGDAATPRSRRRGSTRSRRSGTNERHPGARVTARCSRRPDVVKVFRGGDGAEVARARRAWTSRSTRGEMVAIIGASGAGKSTLLHLLGALERAHRRRRAARRASASRTLDDDALAALRNRSVGFVFQFHHLLREFTALENVMMPLLHRRAGPPAEARDRAAALLARVGLGHRAEPPAGGAVRRRAAAHGGGARAGDATRRCCWPTSRRAISTTHNAERLHDLFAELARRWRLGARRRDPQSVAGRPGRPRAPSRRAAACARSSG